MTTFDMEAAADIAATIATTIINGGDDTCELAARLLADIDQPEAVIIQACYLAQAVHTWHCAQHWLENHDAFRRWGTLDRFIKATWPEAVANYHQQTP